MACQNTACPRLAPTSDWPSSICESRHALYLLRLAAFVLIIIGIVDKNRRERRWR
jgi:hypothetical protein